MFSYFKKDKIISISTVLVIVVFIFSVQFSLVKADDLPVVDVDQIEVSTRIADLLSGDSIGEGAEYYRLQAAEKLAEERALLKQVTEATIKTVNTGNNGNPYYVTNVNQYLSSTTDSTIRNFQKDPALDSVCEPYKEGVKKTALEVKPTLEKKIGCSVPSTELEKYNSGETFSWDTWNKVNSEPQNTFLGAQLITLTEQQKRIEDDVEAAKLEATWGNGFTPIKICDPTKANPDKGYDGCDVKTPGEVIANRLNTADISQIKQMEMATDYNEITMILASTTKYSDPGSLSLPKGLQTNSGPSKGTGGTGTGTGGTGTGTGGTGTGGTGTGTGGGDYNPDGTIDFDISISTSSTGQKTVNTTKALQLIDLQITTEIQYYNAQNNLFNLLDLTQTSFASSTASACTTTIKNPIISQIIGYPTYDQTNSANLAWNKKDIERVSNVVVSNIKALNTAKSNIISSSNNQAIINQVQNLANIKTMHSTIEVTSYSANGTAYNQVKNWVASKINTNLTSCNINKTPFSGWGI